MRFRPDDVDQPPTLDLPCPACGEYAVRAEAHLRDVAVEVTFPAAGEVVLDLRHHGTQVLAIACEACGDELDPEDDDVAERVERYLDARVRLAADDEEGGAAPGWLTGA